MSTMDGNEENKRIIEEEIKGVNQLCEQMEDYIKQPKNKDSSSNGKCKRIRGKNLSMDANANYSKLKVIDSPRKGTASPGVNKSSAKKNNSADKQKNGKLKVIKLQRNAGTEEKKKPSTKNAAEGSNYNTSSNAKLTPQEEGMINRFKDYNEEKKNKLEKLKQKMQAQEEENIKKVPEINENSKKIIHGSEEFLVRMQRLKELSEQKKKDQKEKEDTRKAQIEKEFEEIANKKGKKVDQGQLKDNIESMLIWEHGRKEKITKLQEEEKKKAVEECTFKPEINKNSAKIASSKKVLPETQDSVKRLYTQDLMKRKQKKELLKDIYTPTFSPVTYTTNYKTGSLMPDINSTDKSKQNINEYSTNKESKEIEDMLRSHVKMLRNKNTEN